MSTDVDTADTPAGSLLRFLVIIVVAVLGVVAADVLFAALVPPPMLREVDDAVSEYEHEDPTVLVLGSSHARSFVYFDRVARERTHGRVRFMPVPLEAGQFTGFLWVLEHRLRALIEERDSSGQLARPSLRDLVIVGEWWDATRLYDDGPPQNLPARCWRFEHFLADVWRHGITPYNRNYLQQRWRMLFRRSSLVQDHGHGRIQDSLVQLVRPKDPAVLAQQQQEWEREFAGKVEKGVDQLDAPEHWEAIETLFKYGRDRGLRVTMIHYPYTVITEKARKTTLAVFQARLKTLCDKHDVRLVDWSLTSPLEHKHFESSLDHVTVEGNEIISRWGLDNDLSFLLEPADANGEPARSER